MPSGELFFWKAWTCLIDKLGYESYAWHRGGSDAELVLRPKEGLVMPGEVLLHLQKQVR